MSLQQDVLMEAANQALVKFESGTRSEWSRRFDPRPTDEPAPERVEHSMDVGGSTLFVAYGLRRLDPLAAPPEYVTGFRYQLKLPSVRMRFDLDRTEALKAITDYLEGLA